MKAALPIERMWDVTDPDDSHVFNVVVAYDNLRAGQRAMCTLTSLVDQFRGARVEMRPQLWRFDLLDKPQWFKAALADAIRADMLIVSTSSANNNLSPTVKVWINECLARNQSVSGTVVALPGAECDPKMPRFQFLKSAAVEAGLDFFMPQTSLESVAILPAAMLHQPSSEGLNSIQPYQHWGLNE